MRLLVTAGPTVEPIDPVRFLSNRSSGTLGYCVASAAARRGHRVTLVSGPVALEAPRGVRRLRVRTAREMLAACRRAWPAADALVMAAAVADFRPARAASRKLPKGGVPRLLRLAPNPDLLASLCRRKGGRLALGFALENRLSLSSARRKMRAKGCDAIVLAALPSIGTAAFRGMLVPRAGRPLRLPRSKSAAARAIVRWLEKARKIRTARRRASR